MRRALRELPGIELAVIAPDANRSASARSITTRTPLWVEEVELRRRHERLRDRRHAGRLRSLRGARAGRVRAGADRLGHQPRRQPRRRHHLLGHGRRGARGRGARRSGDRGLAAVEEARDGLPPRARVRLRARSPSFTARLVARLDGAADARRDAAEHQLPGARRRRAARRRGDAARQADLPRQARAPGGGRRAASVRRRRYRIYGDDPSYHHEEGTDFAAIHDGQDLRHAAPLRADRRRAAWRSCAAGTSRACSRPQRTRRSPPS